MTGAIAPLTDFSGWARGDLLVIVLLVLGAILLTRLADWGRGQSPRPDAPHATTGLRAASGPTADGSDPRRSALDQGK